MRVHRSSVASMASLMGHWPRKMSSLSVTLRDLQVVDQHQYQHQHHRHHHHQHHLDHRPQAELGPSSGLKAKCSGSIRYKNIQARPSVPVLFVLVCFLVIANSNCDNVGSTNVLDGVANKRQILTPAEADRDSSEPQPQQAAALAMHIKTSTSAPMRNKYNALNVLREIYLDSNSKVTMFSPEDELVQKFHPNGRYGRRSVDNFAEAHHEFGKLVPQPENDQSDSPSAASNTDGGGSDISLDSLLRSIRLSLADSNSGRVKASKANRQLRQQLAEALTAVATSRDNELDQLNSALSIEDLGGRHQLDSNKLLRCSFSGIANLYKCNSATVQRIK